MSIPPIEEKCSRCNKCVEVAIIASSQDFNSGSMASECTKKDCPVNAENKPNCDERVSIYFVDCE